MDTIYIGVDFHARQQTICYLTTETGEFVTHELKHQDKDEVRTFYAQFGGRVIVGLEARTASRSVSPSSRRRFMCQSKRLDGSIFFPFVASAT